MCKYKICVYAICKNEEQFVDRWMDAVSEADMVIVTDTGSTDHTVERLRERGAVVYSAVVSPWRFDVARNVALGHVPEDTDICVSNDLDEVFEKAGGRSWKASGFHNIPAHATCLPGAITRTERPTSNLPWRKYTGEAAFAGCILYTRCWHTAEKMRI